jgi:hypothetical protein
MHDRAKRGLLLFVEYVPKKVVNMKSAFLFKFCRRVSLLLGDDYHRRHHHHHHHHHLQQNRYHQRSGTT